MSPTIPAPAARRSLPARLVGTASILAGRRYVGSFAVEALSASNALVVGDDVLDVGQALRVYLDLPGCAAPLRCEGRVVGKSARGDDGVFALALLETDADVEDAIQSAALRHLDSGAAVRPEVLIVDASADDALWLERDVQELGFRAHLVADPAEAIGRLRARSPEGGAFAVIASGLIGEMDGLAFLQFVGHDYPDVRRIFAPGAPRPSSHEASPDEAIASGGANAVLRRPWTRELLAAALDKAA